MSKTDKFSFTFIGIAGVILFGSGLIFDKPDRIAIAGVGISCLAMLVFCCFEAVKGGDKPHA